MIPRRAFRTAKSTWRLGCWRRSSCGLPSSPQLQGRYQPKSRVLLCLGKTFVDFTRCVLQKRWLQNIWAGAVGFLMLGAMAPSIVLGEEPFLAAAEKNLAFLRRELWDPETRTLYHRWRDGARDTVQLQEAYAYLLLGTLDLYEATLKADHLEFAVALAEAMLAKPVNRLSIRCIIGSSTVSGSS